MSEPINCVCTKDGQCDLHRHRGEKCLWIIYTVMAFLLGICLALYICPSAHAQDAVVVELPKTDAATAKTLYDAKVAADNAWDSFDKKITQTYKGFDYGITFSKDFRFIVPKAYQSGTATWQWNCLTTVPSTGTFTTPTITPYSITGDLTSPK
jgi:hypothetical protein